MNHDELQEKCRKAFGRNIPLEAREPWANFIRSKGLRFSFRYEWIRDNRFYNWALNNLEVSDGEERFTVWCEDK